jgi:hypothetical protein
LFPQIFILFYYCFPNIVPGAEQKKTRAEGTGFFKLKKEQSEDIIRVVGKA